MALGPPGRRWRGLQQPQYIPFELSLSSSFRKAPVLELESQPPPPHRTLLSTGLSDSFTINCSGFDQHGVNPTAFQPVFDRKAFRPFLNHSIPTQVNVSFTLSAILEVVSSKVHFQQLLRGTNHSLSCQCNTNMVHGRTVGVLNGLCMQGKAHL